MTRDATSSNTRRRGPARTRRPLALLAALAVAVGVVLAACSPEEIRAVQLVNGSRAAAGAAPLETRLDLYLVAQSWSAQLARDGYLHHRTDLSVGVGGGWRKLGENVGRGATVEQVHAAFMASPSHRMNILDRSFDSVGIGATRDSAGRIWIVQEFMDRF